jgi:hypothetical protein
VISLARRGNNNILVVPQALQALEQLKNEVAQELGITIPADGYYGYKRYRNQWRPYGKKMVQIAEQQLSGFNR